MNPIFIILINIVITVAITFYFTNKIENDLKPDVRYNSSKISEVDANLIKFAEFLHKDIGENNKEIDEKQSEEIDKIKKGFRSYYEENKTNQELLTELPEILKDIAGDLEKLKKKVGI